MMTFWLSGYRDTLENESAGPYLWTSGKGRKLRVDVMSSPQSSMMVVDLNLSTLQGRVGCPDRQY